MISDAEYLQRRRYHLRWSIRYNVAAFVCSVSSLWAWPNPRGLVALAAGIVLYGCAERARRRAHEVLP